MKKENLMKEVRAYIIGFLGSITFILVCCEPADEEYWYLQFFMPLISSGAEEQTRSL